MKSRFAFSAFAIGSSLLFASTVSATQLVLSSGFEEAIAETHSFSGFNGVVPDGSPVGWSNSQSIVSDIFSIQSVSVTVNIASEFNGDLYAYIAHQSGFAVLLNRVGRTEQNPFGYADQGFQITFSDAAINGDVHNYQNIVTPAFGSPLTGIWQPDGRNVDPDYVTDQSERTAFLSSFNGLNANGEWVLFVADMSGGSPTTVNSWELEITGVIPEPSTYALILGLGAGLALLIGRRGQRVQA